MIGESKYLLWQRPVIVWTSNIHKGQGLGVIPEPDIVQKCQGLNNDSSISSQCKIPHVYQQNVNVPFPIVAPPWTSRNLPSFPVDYQELVATLVALKKAEHANHKRVCVLCHPNRSELRVFGYTPAMDQWTWRGGIDATDATDFFCITNICTCLCE